jgi:hypothetical protein
MLDHLGRVGCTLAVPDVLLVVPDAPWLCRMYLGCAGCTLVVLDATVLDAPWSRWSRPLIGNYQTGVSIRESGS